MSTIFHVQRRQQALNPRQSHLCQLVKALHVPFQALHVFLTCKATVTIHDEGHVFRHGSSLGDIMQISRVRGELGYTDKKIMFITQYRAESISTIDRKIIWQRLYFLLTFKPAFHYYENRKNHKKCGWCCLIIL